MLLVPQMIETNSLLQEIEFYDRMYKEANIVKEKLQAEKEKYEERVITLSKVVMAHCNEPLYRRGLANACFEVKECENKANQIGQKISGVYETMKYADEKKSAAVVVLRKRGNVGC